MVDEHGLKMLDRLEGHPIWYKREITPIRMYDNTIMDCWVYFNEKNIIGRELHDSYDEDYSRHRLNYELF